jgi:hypothetical protein
MIPNGIYVRSNMDCLVGELSGGLRGLNRVENTGLMPPDSSGSMPGVVLLVSDRGKGWCCIQLTGKEEAVGIVARFLTGHKSLEKVLVWDCNDESMEYSYTFFQGGKLLEQFTVKGPVLEAVSFVSELRQVRLQDLINGKAFAEEAVERFGLHADNETAKESGRVRLDFSLPPKRSIWKSLLGVLAGGE